MTDQQKALVELAAKAVGKRVVDWNVQGPVPVAVLADGTHFQPLLKNSITDCAGDALRLATDLHLSVSKGLASVPGVHKEGWFTELDYAHSHPHEATCLAITRAAAFIAEQRTKP